MGILSFKKVIKRHKRTRSYKKLRNLLCTEKKQIKKGTRQKVNVTFPKSKRLTPKKIKDQQK